MDKKEKILKRIIMTGFITLGYSIVWMLLELLIKGQIRDNIVDNIIMGFCLYQIHPHDSRSVSKNNSQTF